MKKIDTSNIALGVRRQGFTKGSLDHLQEGISESLTDLIKGLTSQTASVVALFGVVNSGSGLNYNISAGSLFYNGEDYTIPVFVGTASAGQVPVLSIVSTPRAGDPVKFSDGNSFNVNLIRTMQWSFGASGSGLSDYLALQRLSNLLDALLNITNSFNTVASNLASEASTRATADSNEASTRSTAVSNEASTRATNDTAETNARIAADALKANKAQNAWTSLTLKNGWGGVLKYRIDELGKIHLSGVINTNSATQPQFCDTPGAINPGSTLIIPSLVVGRNAAGSAFSTPPSCLVKLNATEMTMSTNYTASWFYEFRNFSYWPDEQ